MRSEDGSGFREAIALKYLAAKFLFETFQDSKGQRGRATYHVVQATRIVLICIRCIEERYKHGWHPCKGTDAVTLNGRENRRCIKTWLHNDLCASQIADIGCGQPIRMCQGQDSQLNFPTCWFFLFT